MNTDEYMYTFKRRFRARKKYSTILVESFKWHY